MDTALVIVRLALALVLLSAALGKATDRAGTRRAVVDLGLPHRSAPAVALALPMVEVVLALGLLPRPTAWVAALGTAVLFSAFTVLVMMNVARGNTPDCHCFGQLSNKPVGWTTVARNAVLLGGALFVVLLAPPDAGPGVMTWAETLAPAGQTAEVIVGLAAVVALQGLALVQLAGRVLSLGAPTTDLLTADAEVDIEIAGLAPGTTAPEFALPDLDGATVTLADLRAPGLPVLLLFTDPGCASCNGMLPEIAAWQRDRAAQLTVAVLTRGGADANRDKVDRYGVERVLLQADQEVAVAYRYAGTPGAVVVDADGRVASRMAAGAGDIRALVTEAVGNGDGGIAEPDLPAADLEVGEPAPTFHLHGLGGEHVTEHTLTGRLSLVVFWDPLCGFCQDLLPELRQLEPELAGSGVQVLILSSGSGDATRALGFRSTVVLDEASRVTRAFGAYGTPMARLVDANGQVASDPAAGAPEVLALAERAITLSAAATSLARG